MKTLMISLFLAVASATAVNAQEYTANVKKSILKWHGKKVTGEHWGNINLKNGSMTISNNQITSGVFVIDMNSITVTDLTDPGYNQKLVNHLKSDDFFGVASHPEAKIEIVKSTPFNNNEATVDAKLTIKNITHPVYFTAKKNGNVYTADLVVDRSKYNVRYGSGSFFDNLGDNMIYDNFEMSVTLHMNDDSQASR